MQLKQWMDASVEAFCDFVAQTFFIEEFLDPHNTQPLSAEELSSLKDRSGASIRLNLTAKQQVININILAKQQVLTDMANRILNTADDEFVDENDVIDATKEMVNVIAGGIKSRLSSDETGEITLELPVYINEYSVINNTRFSAVRLFIHNKEEIVLIVSYD